MSLPIQRAHLDGLVVFVAVAELRGFRAAARQLGVTPSAISQTIRALGSLIVNDVEVCLRAVLRGVGFARLPISLVMSYIEKGEVETALDEYADEVPGLMLYYPSRSRSLPKLRAFAHFAQKRMRRDFRAGDYLPTVLP